MKLTKQVNINATIFAKVYTKFWKLGKAVCSDEYVDLFGWWKELRTIAFIFLLCQFYKCNVSLYLLLILHSQKYLIANVNDVVVIVNLFSVDKRISQVLSNIGYYIGNTISCGILPLLHKYFFQKCTCNIILIMDTSWDIDIRSIIH